MTANGTDTASAAGMKATPPPAAAPAAVPLSPLPRKGRRSVEYRPIPGFSRHRMGSDRTVLSETNGAGALVPLSVRQTTAGRTYVMLFDGSTQRALFVDTLFRYIFPELVDRPARKAAVEYRLCPGWPGYRVGADRSVWVDKTRPGLPPPWNKPRWRRLKNRSMGGQGAYVSLRHGAAKGTRSVELLWRAAFADPTHQPGWARRIGPPAMQASPVEPPVPLAMSPSCLAALDLAEVKPAIAEAEPLPPPVEYRPVPGFPRYHLGSDRTVCLSGDPDSEGQTVQARRDQSGRETVLLRDHGRDYVCALDDLVQATFLDSAPPADDGRDSTVESLPIPGFPRHEIGSDNSVWVRVNDAVRRRLGLPLPWQRLTIIGKPGRASVVLWRDGNAHVRYVSDLRREAFARTLPTGPARSIVAPRGSAHGRARLDETKVAEARRLHADGWNVERLAERYGVAPNTMGYALSGKTWAHVPPCPKSSAVGGQIS